MIFSTLFFICIL